MNSKITESNAIDEHVRECDDCARAGLPIEELTAHLNASTVNLDPAPLTRRALPLLTRALAEQAARAVRRRVVLGVLFSLAPLGAVVACDVWILQAIHAVLERIFPARLATWLVLNYAAAILLMFGATYAAIPLLVSRQIRGRRNGRVRPDLLGD